MGSRGIAAVVALTVAAIAPSAHAAGAKVSLFHDTFSTVYRSPGGAVPTGTSVRLRLRVTGATAKRVALRVEVGSTVKMLKLRRAGSFWSVTYRTPSQPTLVSYSFRVQVARGVLWYGDDDSGSDIHKGGTGKTTRLRGDSFNLTVYERSFTTPSWLQGAVVYEIFADRFRNGDETNDYCRPGSTTGCPTFYGDIPATIHPLWNEPLEDSRATGVFNRDFFGGDLEGVREKLDYLKALGVDAIWLTPIFKARSNHRYDTDDYQQVDPGLGGDSAFVQLANAAKAHGIRLILDGVFNHTSSDSVYFDRYHRYPDVVGACESPSSRYRNWYEITGSDVPCRTYSGFANLDSLPTLNESNPAVRDFIYGRAGVVSLWTFRGVDGWRLDAAQDLSHGWWRDFRRTVKGYAPDVPLIGEVTAGPENASPYLLGNELDGVMNYRFRQAAVGFFRSSLFTDSSSSIPALRPSELDHSLKAVLEDYPKQAAAVSFNLVDSHDTNRVLFALTEADDLMSAFERQRLVALLQFTSVGAPMIYYGDEAGIFAPGKAGFGDPYNRAPYPWDDASGDVSRFGKPYGAPIPALIAYYSRLAAIRHALPAVRNGALTTLLTGDTTKSASDNNVYAFARVAPPDKPVIVVVNKSGPLAEADVPVRGLYPDGATLRDELTGVQFQVSGGRIHVDPRGGVILVGTS